MKNIDVGLITAILMLVIWAIVTFVINDAPGITHALLTAGVALLIWRIVKRSGPSESGKPPQP